MNTLPEEIERNIYSYVMTCNSHSNYIFNKSSLKYYKDKAEYRYCAPIKLFNKDICQFCFAKEIRFLKIMSYNL